MLLKRQNPVRCVPTVLQHLYEGVDSNGKHFLANIRKYNSAFQMTSFGCNEVSMAGFNPSFRIQGQVCLSDRHADSSVVYA